MRCPHCQHNQRYRYGMVCSKCSYRFVLNPKAPPYSADRAFAKSIVAASGDGRRWYTANLLHEAIFRPRNRSVLRRLFLAPGSSDVGATRAALEQWIAARNSAGNLVDKLSLGDLSFESAAWPEPDLFDYGAEGVLVVDDRILVDLLVRNGVHTDARVAVISADGYPQAVTERMHAAAADRSDLPVFLLHSSGVGAAEELDRRIRGRLSLEEHPVFDLGLHEDAPRRVPGLRWARRLDAVAVDMLPPQVLTTGVVAAIANRVSIDDVLHPPDDADARSGWVFFGDGDDDFG
jgi:hypothetical protein